MTKTNKSIMAANWSAVWRSYSYIDR